MTKSGQLVPLRRARFADFELLPDASSLLHRGHRLKLQPQPLRVLAYLIARSPAIVTREELGEYVWQPGVHVDLDQSLGYCVRQIRLTLGDNAAQPRFVETLPRQGYRFVCPVELLPDRTWDELSDPRIGDQASALGSAEAKISVPSVPAETAVASTASRTDIPADAAGKAARQRWVAGAVAVACSLFAALLPLSRHVLRGKVTTQPVESLAVLPIENLSGDPGQAYIADGLTDELITMLAKDSTLRIISRTSVMPYKGAHRPLPEVARTLGADAILEGSIARSGTRTHVTLQLIRAANDSHLWAESYDRDANDFTVPSQAAQAIAKQLHSEATSPHPVRFVAPAAHDAYLRGRYLWPTQRMAESGPYFRKATEIQPDYAEAWAGLANFYGEEVAAGILDPRAGMPLEEEAARRALVLAPDLALAHQAMSGAYLIDRWDWQDADREVLLAISLDPNDAESYYLRANVLEASNRFPEAIEVEKKAMELEPYERPEGLASIYFGARLFDEALAEIKLRSKAAPNNPGLLFQEKEVWRCKGNYKEAMEALAKFHVVTGDPHGALALRHAYELGGSKGFVRWELQRRLLQAKEGYVSPIELASYYAQLGDREHTLALLEEGYRQHSTDFLWIPGDPAYDFLHGDTRYQALMSKLRQL